MAQTEFVCDFDLEMKKERENGCGKTVTCEMENDPGLNDCDSEYGPTVPCSPSIDPSLSLDYPHDYDPKLTYARSDYSPSQTPPPPLCPNTVSTDAPSPKPYPYPNFHVSPSAEIPSIVFLIHRGKKVQYLLQEICTDRPTNSKDIVQVNELIKDVCALENDNEYMENKIVEKNKTIHYLEMVIRKRKKMTTGKNEIIKFLNHKLKSLETDLQNLEDSFYSCDYENEALAQQVQNLETDLQKSDELVSSLKTEKLNLSQTISKLKNDQKKSEHEIFECRQLMKTLQNEIQNFRIENSMSETKLEIAQSENKKLKKELESSKNENLANEKKIRNESLAIEKLSSENESLSNHVVDLMSELEKLQEQVASTLLPYPAPPTPPISPDTHASFTPQPDSLPAQCDIFCSVTETLPPPLLCDSHIKSPVEIIQEKNDMIKTLGFENFDLKSELRKTKMIVKSRDTEIRRLSQSVMLSHGMMEGFKAKIGNLECQVSDLKKIRTYSDSGPPSLCTLPNESPIASRSMPNIRCDQEFGACARKNESWDGTLKYTGMVKTDLEFSDSSLKIDTFHEVQTDFLHSSSNSLDHNDLSQSPPQSNSLEWTKPVDVPSITPLDPLVEPEYALDQLVEPECSLVPLVEPECSLIPLVEPEGSTTPNGISSSSGLSDCSHLSDIVPAWFFPPTPALPVQPSPTHIPKPKPNPNPPDPPCTVCPLLCTCMYPASLKEAVSMREGEKVSRKVSRFDEELQFLKSCKF